MRTENLYIHSEQTQSQTQSGITKTDGKKSAEGTEQEALHPQAALQPHWVADGQDPGPCGCESSLPVSQMWSLPQTQLDFPEGSPGKPLIVSEDREGATDPSPSLWHSTKHCLTGTNDQRSCRNNFLLMWSKFSTREHYTQSQTVHPHPDPHKSMFAEGMRKILRFTARVMGNFPEQVGCWAPPSCFPPNSARGGSKKVQ